MSTPIGGIGQIGGARLDGGGIRLDAFAPGESSFANTLKQAIGDISNLQEEATDAIGAFVRGEPVELHQVMAAVEEAGIALDLLIELRNKVTDAYRTVINMQS